MTKRSCFDFVWLRNVFGIREDLGSFEKNKLPGRSASAFRQVGDAQIIDPNTVIHTGDAHRLPRCPASVNIKIIQIKQSILHTEPPPQLKKWNEITEEIRKFDFFFYGGAATTNRRLLSLHRRERLPHTVLAQSYWHRSLKRSVEAKSGSGRETTRRAKIIKSRRINSWKGLPGQRRKGDVAETSGRMYRSAETSDTQRRRRRSRRTWGKF